MIHNRGNLNYNNDANDIYDSKTFQQSEKRTYASNNVDELIRLVEKNKYCILDSFITACRSHKHNQRKILDLWKSSILFCCYVTVYKVKLRFETNFTKHTLHSLVQSIYNDIMIAASSLQHVAKSNSAVDEFPIFPLDDVHSLSAEDIAAAITNLRLEDEIAIAHSSFQQYLAYFSSNLLTSSVKKSKNRYVFIIESLPDYICERKKLSNKNCQKLYLLCDIISDSKLAPHTILHSVYHSNSFKNKNTDDIIAHLFELLIALKNIYHDYPIITQKQLDIFTNKYTLHCDYHTAHKYTYSKHTSASKIEKNNNEKNNNERSNNERSNNERSNNEKSNNERSNNERSNNEMSNKASEEVIMENKSYADTTISISGECNSNDDYSYPNAFIFDAESESDAFLFTSCLKSPLLRNILLIIIFILLVIVLFLQLVFYNS